MAPQQNRNMLRASTYEECIDSNVLELQRLECQNMRGVAVFFFMFAFQEYAKTSFDRMRTPLVF